MRPSDPSDQVSTKARALQTKDWERLTKLQHLLVELVIQLDERRYPYTLEKA